MPVQQLFSLPVYGLPNAVPLTVSTTVVSISANSIPAGASGAIISNAVGAGTVNGAYGVDPTTTLGMPLAAGEAVVIEDSLDFVSGLRWIRQGGSDGTLTFQFIAARASR